MKCKEVVVGPEIVVIKWTCPCCGRDNFLEWLPDEEGEECSGCHNVLAFITDSADCEHGSDEYER